VAGAAVVRYNNTMAGRANDWLRQAQRDHVLDNGYIPTRYPNSHPAGAPFEHYGPLQSRQAVEYAGQILEFVRSSMA